MSITRADVEELRYAKALLENPGLAAKITSVFGTPIEKGFSLLPDRWADIVNQATRKALEQALHYAIVTIDDRRGGLSSDRFHKVLAAASGAAGGAFGLPALAVELPVSTTIMLRSIADIARSEGEILKVPEAKIACIEVFALGGSSRSDDATETGYFAVRAALARAVTEAARFIAQKGVVYEGAPALIGFIAKVASRFGVVVSQKVAAGAVPVIGAAGGALINTLFIDHFQDMARGHFIIRRLERSHGFELVRGAYSEL